MAVQAVIGGHVVWHCQYDPEDRRQAAARILAHHWPHVPNLGDITAVTWERVLDQYGPIDVLTGGFPCQDVSAAGQRAGLAEGTRSGLWSHMAHAISVLNPRLVVIENVPGLLSARADGHVDPRPTCLGDGGDEPPLRALGAVLGDLADLRFDAEWTRVAASEVGAPHRRERVFVLAWPADTGREGLARRRTERTAPHRDITPAHTLDVGEHGGGACGPGRNEPASRRLTPAHADSGGQGTEQPDLLPGQPDIAWGDYAPAVRRWEAVIGRPAPRPTDTLGRLTPVLVEWLMGLPAGHVTAVPGLSRTAQLRALGNGVVPQQATHALYGLLARAEVGP